jgi:protein-S-isoprenylcysteine O-methyltransferase Ste14
MNALKTILYMGGMHGFFTFYLPFQLAQLDSPLFDLGILRAIAFPLWIAGTWVIIRCTVDIIRRGRGTPSHLDPPKALIVTGLYRYVRNPIYVGALLVQLGTIAWSGSRLLILYFLCFTVALHVLIVFFEEPVLQNKFGAAYDEYRQGVPRWIPKLHTPHPK